MYNQKQKFGRIYPETAYHCFPHDPTMVRKPDVSVLSYQKWPANRKIGSYITVPPDLAVEVVSPNETYQEVREKVGDYLKADIPLIWVVNESTRQVEAYSKQEVKVLSGDDELTGGDVIPGFRCLVSEIFADIPTEE
jgi:Uma2 family endonuclease